MRNDKVLPFKCVASLPDKSFEFEPVIKVLILWMTHKELNLFKKK